MYEETLPFAFAVGNMKKQAIRRHLLQQATENGALLWKVEKVSINMNLPNHTSCAKMHGIRSRG